MATELTHIWLLVNDMPLTRNFYRDTLGIEVLNDLGEYVEFRANPQFQLTLFTRDAFLLGEPTIPLDPVAGHRAVLAFALDTVDALDASCAQLRAQGVEFVSGEATHAQWGLRTAFLHDPDGNLVCLYVDISA
jgi:catechol 2,3-dioxygenase-like lactoylglutathione lyase family enzyme